MNTRDWTGRVETRGEEKRQDDTREESIRDKRKLDENRRKKEGKGEMEEETNRDEAQHLNVKIKD